MLTAAMACDATAQHFYIQKYTANDGLADSYVLRTLQDSQGFLWIGTYNGLSRFDGKTFTNYGYAAGLPNLSVDVIYEDHLGRIWIGTRKGIAGIRGGACVHYPADDHQAISYVYDIREFRDHGLLALTDKGVYRLDGGSWNKQRLYPGFEDHDCRNMVVMGKDLYINYGDLVVHRDSNGAYKVIGKPYPSRHHYGSLSAIGDELYLSLPDRLLHLKSGDTAVPLFQHALENKEMRGYFHDSRDRFWINTGQDGLLISRKASTTVISDTISIAFNLLSSLYEDREKNIWAACFDGLMKIREVNYALFDHRHYPMLSNTRNLLNIDSTVVACTQAGLVEYRQGRFSSKPLARLPHSPSGTEDDLVDFSARDAQDRTWLVTRKKKLCLLENNMLKDLSGLTHINGDFCWGIAFNKSDKKIYLCSDSLAYGDEHGIQVFRGEKGTVIDKPRAIHAFNDGSLLVYTANNEFFRIDNRKRVHNITARMGIAGSCRAVSFCTEPSGRFWLAYNGGLIRIHWDNQGDPVQELRLTTRDGLPNDAVQALTMDRQGRLWAITSAGLVVIESGSGTPVVIHRLSEEMGISYNQWIQARLLTGKDGAVWMCFLNSIYRFDPQTVQFDNTPPATALEDIQLNLRPTQWREWADSLYGYQQLPRHAVLPYHLNTLSISYKAPCFTGVSGIEYAHQLEGIDSGWSMSSPNSSVSFVKLPPGTYHFKVRARKSDTDWGPPAEFTFRIQRPWWESIWLRLLALALLVMLVAAIFHVRIRQVQRKALISQQLQELELKALRSRMNPHFIYNALNSIQALVLDKKAHEASAYIGKFGRLLRKVLDHSEQNIITLQEELEALELYIQLERLRLNVSLQYRILVDPAIAASEEWLPPLILQPFVENALWHGLSRKEGQRKLDVQVDIKDEWLVVRVVDNGIGRRQAAITARENTPKGMEITGRRIKEHNRGPESSFVDITDLFETDGQPAGTMVILQIRRTSAR